MTETVVGSGRTLISLAVLDVNWDHGRDYIECFIPFIKECIKVENSAAISLQDLQANMIKLFGINIPQNALKTILNRCKHKGIVSQSNGVYLPLEFAPAETEEFRERQIEATDDVNVLVDKFVNYCLTRLDVVIDIPSAESALLEFMALHSIEFVSDEGGAIPGLEVADEPLRVEVASFVHFIEKHDPRTRDLIGRVLRGLILAESLFYPSLPSSSRGFGKTFFYFDTRFLLQSLGLNGESQQAPCLELIGLLKQQEAVLACFEHTLEEIEGVLAFSSRALREGISATRPNDVLHYFREIGYKSSDVERLISQLDEHIQALGLRILRFPAYSDHRFVIAEEAC